MLKLYAADNTDFKWMYNLYKHAAIKVHFVMQNDVRGHELVKRNILSIITEQRINDFDLRAQALVFEKDKNRIGYVVMSEIKAGQGGNEIHLFVVDKEYRGNGYGQIMLASVFGYIRPLFSCFKNHDRFTNKIKIYLPR